MKQKMKKGLYTIIYPFMAGVLNLAGLSKECFAVIFGFWFSQNRHPVGVSLATMQKITGGTRPAVVQAIHKLEEIGLIVAERTPGKKTIYDVVIPEPILTDFMDIYQKIEPVKMFNTQEFIPLTSTGHFSIPQNKRKAKCEPVTTPLKVRPAGEAHTGGLKEA